MAVSGNRFLHETAPFPQKTSLIFGKLRIDFWGGYGMMKVLIFLILCFPNAYPKNAESVPKDDLDI